MASPFRLIAGATDPMEDESGTTHPNQLFALFTVVIHGAQIVFVRVCWFLIRPRLRLRQSDDLAALQFSGGTAQGHAGPDSVARRFRRLSPHEHASSNAGWRIGPRRFGFAKDDRSRSPLRPAAALVSMPSRCNLVPNADADREGHQASWLGAWFGSLPTSPEGLPLHHDWLSLSQSRSPSDVRRKRESRHHDDDSAASPGCSVLAGTTEARCTRARRCRFFVCDTQERSDQSFGRGRRSYNPVSSSSTALPVIPTHHRLCSEMDLQSS